MKKLQLLIALTAACLSTAQAAISVGPGGSILFDFTDGNTVTNAGTGWNTLSVLGASGNATTAAALAALVNTNSTTIITTLLPTTATTPPGANALARRNDTRANIQTVPTGTAYDLLLATLQNDTGSSQSTVTINYTLGDETTGTTTEEVPGHLVFWSLTGTPGSWTEITVPGGGTVGAKSLIANVGSWPVGGTLYILWADDNAAANRDNTGAEEGGYTLDDVQFLPGGVVTESVAITSPTNTATRAFGAPVVITASASMAGTISGVQFYLDGVSIGTDTTSPYSITNTGTALGAHTLRAVATDSTHSITSAVVNFTVVANNAPTVTLTEPVAGTNVLVGTTVNVGATAADPDGAVASVEFYVDNVLRVTDTTAAYTYQYGDSLAGNHTISAVAVDNSGARTTNSTSITVTNVLGVTAVLTNGSLWKYFEGGSDPGANWTTLAYNDAGWSNGYAELGYGDNDVNRIETTVIGFGGNANLKNAAAYFRKTFNVANASSFTGLVVRVLRDDHAIVRLNGNIIYNDMTNALADISYLTYEQPAAPDDGNVYQNTNASNFLVNGPNILAVEVHQNATNSSDLSFDMMLLGVAPAGSALRIVRTSPNQAEVSWPDSTPVTALLYSTTDLNSPVTWSLVGLPVVQSGGFYRVTVNTTGPQKFYTLRQ